MLDLKAAARTIMESDPTATDDEIKAVIGNLRTSAKTMLAQGKSEAEVEAALGKSKWKDTPLFGPAKAPAEAEKPGFFQNLGQEFRQGVRGALNPSTVEFPGASKVESIPGVGGVARNVIGSGLGAAQAAFSVPTALAKTYVEQPLQGTAIGDTQIPIPFTDKSIPVSQAAGLVAGAALPFAAGPIAGLGSVAARTTAAALDPLGALARGSEAAQKVLSARTSNISKATEKLTAEEAKLAEMERMVKPVPKPEAPTAPTAPAEVSGLVQPKDVASAARESVGREFQVAKKAQTKELFAKSSANYKAIEAKYGDLPVDPKIVEDLALTAEKLGTDLRATTATKATEKALGTSTAGETGGRANIADFAGQPEIQAQIRAQMGTTPTTIRDIMNMRNNLVATNRASKDLDAINANKQLISKIDEAFNAVPGPMGDEFRAASAFHNQVHELVGPKSLAQRVFKQAPENVVDNIFLTEGKTTPNITMVRRAKEIYMREDPAAWATLTQTALQRFGEKITSVKTGLLDVQQFNRSFSKYENTFREALSKPQFDALKAFQTEVQKFNRESAAFRSAQAAVREAEQANKSALAAQRTITHQARREMTATVGPHGMGGVAEQAMSPYTMLALAQVGQALQASFTGNWVGVGRQLAQGVVWYTLGNPRFLDKMINSPKLSGALTVLSSGAQKTGAKVTNAGRALYEAMQEEQQ